MDRSSGPPAPVAVPYVSVVLSFRNEEEILDELIRRLREALGPLRERGEISGHELVFVNDASSDRSEEILRREAETSDDIRLINMSRTFGVAPCVIAGMAHSRGDVVIYMDADLQDPPQLIPELIRVWREQAPADVVHTVRVARDGESAFKKMLTLLGYHILRATATIDLPVEAGDYKLLSRRVVDHLLRFKERSPYIRGLVCYVGFTQRHVFYRRQPRFAGESKFAVLGLKVIRNFFEAALIGFSSVPLRLPALGGAALASVGILYALALAFMGLAGRSVPGWSAVMAAVLLIGGLQLLAIGMMGLYVYAILQEARGRPMYIVRDTAGLGGAAGGGNPASEQR